MIKTLQTRMLHINSWAAAGSGTPTNFSQALSRPITGVTSCRFVSFSCPNLLPPLNTFDNVIKIQTDGNTAITRSVTIDTNRFFTDISVAYVNGLLQASPDVRLHQISFSFNANLLRLVMADMGGSCRPVPYQAGVSEGNYRIGFANTYYPFLGTHVADGYPACILCTDVIKLRVNLIGNSSSAIAADADCIYTVPVDVNVGQLISYAAPHHIEIPCNISNLSEVSVRLTDADNVDLLLPSNAYVTIQISLDCLE